MLLPTEPVALQSSIKLDRFLKNSKNVLTVLTLRQVFKAASGCCLTLADKLFKFDR